MEVQKIAIIDLDSLCYTAFHPNKQLDEFGIPMRTEDNTKFLYVDKSEEEIELSCDNLMRMVLENSKATHYLAFIKGKNTIARKLAVDPTYKQDRTKESPKMWGFTKDYFIKKYGAIEVHDIEVDDAVNIARLSIPDAFICAIDSDLLGLEGTHYNWKTGNWITCTKEEELFKFWKDMIQGTHNNTKGIKGRGKKYVEKLFTNVEVNDCEKIVLDEYLNYFGKEKGDAEYMKNYICLKILDSYEGMEFITPIKSTEVYARTLGVVGE
jgi:hypothetical protein